MLMRKLFLTLLVLASSLGSALSVRALQEYTEIQDQDRGMCDYIPFDIANIPGYFSVKHQMAKYGIAGQDDQTGYQFAQLSQAVFGEVQEVLEQLEFDVQALYILKLNQKWCASAKGAVITNSCIFIDEASWRNLDTDFKGTDIFELKKYILRRAIAQYKRGSYGKKIATKLLISAALGFAMYHAMPHVNDFIEKQDKELGISAAISSAIPTVVANVCSALYIPTILSYVGSMKLSSLLGIPVRLSSIIRLPAQWILDRVIARPVCSYLDYKAEQDALNGSNKDLVYKYNKQLGTVNHT